MTHPDQNPRGFRLGRREKFLICVLAIAVVLLPRYANVQMEASFLHWAVKEGTPLEVALALLVGQDPDRDGHDGYTPFQYAVQLNRVDVVKILLRNGASPDQRDGSRLTAITVAAGEGHEDMVRVLLAGGASAEMKTKGDYYNPLTAPQHMAARNGHLAILRLLMEGRKIPHYESFSSSPYMEGVRSGRPEILDFLLNCRELSDDGGKILQNCFVHAAGLSDGPFLEYLLKKGAPIDSTDEREDTALHQAVERGRVATIEFLLARGLPIDILGHGGESPIFRLVQYPAADLKLAELVVAKGAKLDIVGQWGGLLHKVIGMKDQKMLDFLLEHHADTGVSWNDSGTALHHAASVNAGEMVRALLAAGADPKARTPDGDTPLHHLGKQDHRGESDLRTTVILLRDAGAVLGAVNELAQTVLHTSNVARSPEALELFLEAGVGLETQDLEGDTPLHAACQSSIDLEKIKNLLARGADPAALNLAGKTPADLLRDPGQRWNADKALKLFAAGWRTPPE